VRNRILGPSSRPYSPKLVEEAFSEVRFEGSSQKSVCDVLHEAMRSPLIEALCATEPLPPVGSKAQNNPN
jgi:hypothetical protein